MSPLRGEETESQGPRAGAGGQAPVSSEQTQRREAGPGLSLACTYSLQGPPVQHSRLPSPSLGPRATVILGTGVAAAGSPGGMALGPHQTR